MNVDPHRFRLADVIKLQDTSGVPPHSRFKLRPMPADWGGDHPDWDMISDCTNCERCTWNPGPDCGRREHPHCERCGHCRWRHVPWREERATSSWPGRWRSSPLVPCSCPSS